MKKSGMICAWLLLDDLPIYSVSLAFVHPYATARGVFGDPKARVAAAASLEIERIL
jgi:hypothetical protein